MSKKKIIVLFSILLFIIIIAITWSLYKMNNSDYYRAKKETLKFLDKNITKLEEISKESLSKKDKET